MKQHSIFKVILTFFSLLPFKAFAVDAQELQQRFKLVGVISDDDRPGKKKGVVVLKDIKNGVTMTLRTGDRIPYEDQLKIVAVRRQAVMIGNDSQEVEISYLGSAQSTNSSSSSDQNDNSDNSSNSSDDVMPPIEGYVPASIFSEDF